METYNVRTSFHSSRNPGTLKALKSMGYRTFNKYWDESYDDIEDETLRVQAVADIIYKLSKKSTKELKDLRKDMQDILTYNRANFNVTKNTTSAH